MAFLVWIYMAVRCKCGLLVTPKWSERKLATYQKESISLLYFLKFVVISIRTCGRE